jgi:DNA-binding transcriptional regulator YiaG
MSTGSATRIVDFSGKIVVVMVVFLTPEQSRAARAWMDWTQEQFAKMAKVSISTVRDFESGKRVPIANNLEAMRRAIEEHGLELLFYGDKATGIVMRARTFLNITDTIGGAGTTRGAGG